MISRGKTREGDAKIVGNKKHDREAEMIKKRRKALGMTQSQTAAEIGIELQAYQRYEYGVAKLSNATMKLGLRICAALELDPFEAVFESGEDVAGVEKKEKAEFGGVRKKRKAEEISDH